MRIGAKCALREFRFCFETPFLIGIKNFEGFRCNAFQVDPVTDFFSLFHAQPDSLLRIVSKFLLFLEFIFFVRSVLIQSFINLYFSLMNLSILVVTVTLSFIKLT